MKTQLLLITAFLLACSISLPFHAAHAQDNQNQLHIDAGGDRQTYPGKNLSFDIGNSTIPDGTNVKEVLWNFGDATSTTGGKVSHIYKTPGTYNASVNVTTDKDSAKTTFTVKVLKAITILLADGSVTTDQTNLLEQQAAADNVLLLTLRPQDNGPEAVTEEDLTNTMLDARDDIAAAPIIITWTSGSVGANVLSKFAQHAKQAASSDDAINFSSKAVVMLSDTPFAVLAPTAQSAFDQLQPAYILLTKPAAASLVLHPMTADEAKTAIFNSSFDHRLLGTFSTRTVRDIGPTNFLSFGINFLVNQGVPINNITLILMLPVIATLLSFSRQVIGIKAFGIITPALTSLTFLVMGLVPGLIVFSTVLLAGTLTRLLVRRLHLLYLPRMALVLTNISLAILVLLGVGTLIPQTATALSFSIFPILILTLLAEDFIAAQFTSGARTALTITAWTLFLSIACYFIVSWQLLRTIIISYPEVVILGIPINILLGRFTGLRLTEYFRFRNLVQHGQ